MNYTLSPRNIFSFLLLITSFLLCSNIAGIISTYYFGHDYVFGIIPLFDFDQENNIPTLFSSISLALSAALLALVAFKQKQIGSPFLPWAGLAVIFAFLTIDETAYLHENLIEPLRHQLDTGGLLFYAWVIPYSIALVVFVILYSRFLFRLPKKTELLLILSGTIYISGAIGFELLGGRHAELYGTGNLLYACYYTCEELLEMLGIILFLYTLLIYITELFGPVTFTVHAEPQPRNSELSTNK